MSKPAIRGSARSSGDRVVFLPLTITPVRIPPRLSRRSRIQEVPGPVQKVAYRYTDAGNWKFWGQFRIMGELSMEDLKPHLIDGEFFVPERIGLPSLVPELKNADDHLLHTFEEIAAVESGPYDWTAQEFVERIRLAGNEGWFAGIC